MSTVTLDSAPTHRIYFELTKPRLTLFVLFVVALGAWLASGGRVGFWTMFHAILGTGLVAGGASAINMLLERNYDARMARTSTRPLPAGHLQGHEVALFGGVLTVVGLVQLAWGTTPLAAALAAITSFTYLCIYTPLKRITTLNTHVGAIPGALPALIGGAAVNGRFEPAAWMIFLIVFLWQLPHFLSIAWLYRRDYEQGGFQMLPVVDPDGGATGRQAVLGALALIPASLLPSFAGVCGMVYFVGALLLGGYFVHAALSFAMARTQLHARRLMRASLVYLPLLLALMFFNRL